MPKLPKKIVLSAFTISSYLFFTRPAYAQTSKWTSRCQQDIGGVKKVATLQGFECVLANIFRIIIPLAGLAAFVVLITGGFQYLTSGGNPEQTKKAQSVITGAIIGLIVTMAIWFIFRLLNTITGLDLLQFAIPGGTPSP